MGSEMCIRDSPIPSIIIHALPIPSIIIHALPIPSIIVVLLLVSVNNVGTNIRKPTTEVSASDYNSIMSTNLESAYHMSQVGAEERVSVGRSCGMSHPVGSVWLLRWSVGSSDPLS